MEYADTPPSMNTNKVRDWRSFGREKKRWEGIFCGLLMKHQIHKGATSVRAKAMIRFPTNRRRDEGNFRMLIEKALGDALQVMKVIPDDGPEQYRFEQVNFDHTKGNKLTTVTLDIEYA